MRIHNHKDRIDKIGRAQGVLGHQAATPVIAAESAGTLAQELGMGVGEIHTALSGCGWGLGWAFRWG